ncbi:MAG: 50S ribosomal protein L28 [Chitinivibrionia bacterium]|nr:50S ribosomal protein L28 [Chitinivibrionia bacterium]
MSRSCDVCGRAPVSGGSVSHAHNVSKRIFKPNIRNVKLEIDGVNKNAKICMRCLKSLSKV